MIVSAALYAAKQPNVLPIKFSHCKFFSCGRLQWCVRWSHHNSWRPMVQRSIKGFYSDYNLRRNNVGVYWAAKHRRRHRRRWQMGRKKFTRNSRQSSLGWGVWKSVTSQVCIRILRVQTIFRAFFLSSLCPLYPLCPFPTFHPRAHFTVSCSSTICLLSNYCERKNKHAIYASAQTKKFINW